MEVHISMKINEILLRKIVRAIEKACGEDIYNYLQENHTETNNVLSFLRGDFINSNLREFVVNDDIELIPFSRNGWSGRILFDKNNKNTYTITTKRTLEAIPKKKGRTMPHYLQSLLFVENGELEAPVKQISLCDFEEFGLVEFEPYELEKDFCNIMCNRISSYAGCRHYVIAYEVEHREVVDISVMFLDKDFDIIEDYSLNEYLKPDFVNLTESDTISDSTYKEDNATPLVSIKEGIKPKLRVTEKRA